MKIILALIILNLGSPVFANNEIDCSGQFPSGKYGFPSKDSVFQTLRIKMDAATAPFFLKKKTISGNKDRCKEVGPSKVFEMTTEKQSLIAGCMGDFNADGSMDYALMQESPEAGAAPIAYLKTQQGYEPHQIADTLNIHKIDPRSGYFPGPICLTKSEALKLYPKMAHLKGDLISLSSILFYWDQKLGKFRELIKRQ